MKKELCEVCTGSYTGEFDPKWRGPWAAYFDAAGNFLELDHDAEVDVRAEQHDARKARRQELRAQGRA